MDCISGLPLYELTTPANTPDSNVAAEILASANQTISLQNCSFIADKGYDARSIYNIITEIATDDGYTLLKDSITVVITSAESGVICDVCGKSGITATATVNGGAVGMIEDNGSVSAIVPMSVINTLGFDLPQTGENGTWLFAVGGVLIVSLSAAFIFFILAKKRKTDEQ